MPSVNGSPGAVPGGPRRLRERIFEGLNDEQARAVAATRGPVVILAGASSGKTTTITRRIANQIVTGEFEPKNILAVTYTTKAAGELIERLARVRHEPSQVLAAIRQTTNVDPRARQRRRKRSCACCAGSRHPRSRTYVHNEPP